MRLGGSAKTQHDLGRVRVRPDRAGKAAMLREFESSALIRRTAPRRVIWALLAAAMVPFLAGSAPFFLVSVVAYRHDRHLTKPVFMAALDLLKASLIAELVVTFCGGTLIWLGLRLLRRETGLSYGASGALGAMLALWLSDMTGFGVLQPLERVVLFTGVAVYGGLAAITFWWVARDPIRTPD